MKSYKILLSKMRLVDCFALFGAHRHEGDTSMIAMDNQPLFKSGLIAPQRGYEVINASSLCSIF